MRGVGSLSTDRIGHRTVVMTSFYFLMGPCLFCNVFPFPVGWAQLKGDWYENRQGAPNTIIFLIFRQYYWCTDAPCANRSGRLIRKKILLAHCAWSALPIGGGGHRCANILAHRGPPTPIYWHSDVPCANSISISIILYARLFLQSSELGPPNPLTHRWVCPPFGARGGHTCRRGGGWGPNTRGQTLWYSRYHVTSFTSPIGDWT